MHEIAIVASSHDAVTITNPDLVESLRADIAELAAHHTAFAAARNEYRKGMSEDVPFNDLYRNLTGGMYANRPTSNRAWKFPRYHGDRYPSAKQTFRRVLEVLGYKTYHDGRAERVRLRHKETE